MSICPTQKEVSACALLWDLDNVSVRVPDLAALAAALTHLVDRKAPRVAAANWRAFRLSRAALAAQGVRLLSAGRHPGGADAVLLRQARKLRRLGVTRFVVASNDHAFARLADTGELHVVTLTGDYVSRRLRGAATSVTVLGRDGDGWTPWPGGQQPSQHTLSG